MARQLTEKQQKFLAVLFDEAGGDMVTAKKMAGYSDATTTTEIVVTFSSNVDETSLTGNLKVYSESANGDPSLFATGDLVYNTGVAGNVLTITLDPDQLFQNNIIVSFFESKRY